MQCPNCGFLMSAFDDECPRCQGKKLPVKTPPQNLPAQATRSLPLNRVPPAQQGQVVQYLYCRLCGSPNPSDATFCASCGQSVETPPQQIQPPAQQVHVHVTQQNNNGGCGCGGCFWTIIIFMILSWIISLFGG